MLMLVNIVVLKQLTLAHTQCTDDCKLCASSSGIGLLLSVRYVVGSNPGVTDIGIAFLLIIKHQPSALMMCALKTGHFCLQACIEHCVNKRPSTGISD